MNNPHLISDTVWEDDTTLRTTPNSAADKLKDAAKDANLGKVLSA